MLQSLFYLREHSLAPTRITPRKLCASPALANGRQLSVEVCLMSASHLNLVDLSKDDSEVYVMGQKPETRAERIKRMQSNAKALAREQIEAMTEAMLEVARMADEVAVGGDAYPVGVREMASRLRADLENQAKSIDALLART